MFLNQIVSLYLVQEVTIYPPASVERFYIALFMYHSWELWLFGQRSKPTRSFVSIYTDIYIHRETICWLDIEYLPLYQFVLTKHFFSVGTIKTLILVNETTVFLVRSHNVSGISNMFKLYAVFFFSFSVWRLDQFKCLRVKHSKFTWCLATI